MKKVVKKLMCALMCVCMVFGLAACGTSSSSESEAESTKSEGTESSASEAGSTDDSSAASDLDTSTTVKMGVLVSDTTSAEALAFRSYYENYIAAQYNVEFVYSDELTDAAGEKSAIDTFITNNCKAIISFSSFDRAAQIEQCESAGVYYAVATGTLTDEEYETYKGYSYYVGAIGPSLDIEYQAGYDMAMYYLEQGVTQFAIFGGAVPYYTDMHIYRVAGMLAAMAEYGEGDYQGATDEAGIVAQIYADGEVKTGDIGSVSVVGYIGGYDMDDAWYGKIAEVMSLDGLEVLLAVGNGSDFFGTYADSTGVKVASVDAYAESYGDAMEAGMLDYLAGKFSASIGPIFMATYNAVLGAKVTTDEGYALALDQGYWIATSYEEFEEYYAVDSSTESPAYDKEKLDTLLGADYDTFVEFVEQYTFEEISAM